MTVAANSIASYLSLDNVELGNRQRLVLEALRYAPACNRALAKRLRLPVNVITPRVKELRDLGLVTEAWDDIDPETNRPVIVWRAV